MNPGALRALLAAGTPGPWENGKHGTVQGYRPSVGYVVQIANARGFTSNTEAFPGAVTQEDDANAALIVALRNHAEALLGVVEAVRELRAIGVEIDAAINPFRIDRLWVLRDLADHKLDTALAALEKS